MCMGVEIARYVVGALAFMPATMFFEYLAGRAEGYLAREGVRTFGSIPQFDADSSVMESVEAQVQRAREAMS